MSWERFVAAMAMLRQCYAEVPEEKWQPRVRLYFTRLRIYPEQAVMRALHEAPTVYRRYLPTLGEIDELCAKHARKLRDDAPQLEAPKLGEQEAKRMSQFLTACFQNTEEAMEMAQWAIDTGRAAWVDGFKPRDEERGKRFATARGWK